MLATSRIPAANFAEDSLNLNEEEIMNKNFKIVKFPELDVFAYDHYFKYSFSTFFGGSLKF